MLNGFLIKQTGFRWKMVPFFLIKNCFFLKICSCLIKIVGWSKKHLKFCVFLIEQDANRLESTDTKASTGHGPLVPGKSKWNWAYNSEGTLQIYKLNSMLIVITDYNNLEMKINSLTVHRNCPVKLTSYHSLFYLRLVQAEIKLKVGSKET